MTKQQAMTLELSKAFAEVRNAATRFEVLRHEKECSHYVKKEMHRWTRNLKSIERDFKMMFVDIESRKAVEEQLLNDEDSLQIEFITDAVVGTTKEKRDEIEKFIEELLNQPA